MHLEALPDRKDKEIKFRFFHSVTEGIRFLREDRVAVGSGDNGAISLWIDDNGKYRGEFQRFHVPQNRVIGAQKDLKRWLTRWFPKLGR